MASGDKRLGSPKLPPREGLRNERWSSGPCASDGSGESDAAARTSTSKGYGSKPSSVGGVGLSLVTNCDCRWVRSFVVTPWVFGDTRIRKIILYTRRLSILISWLFGEESESFSFGVIISGAL